MRIPVSNPAFLSGRGTPPRIGGSTPFAASSFRPFRLGQDEPPPPPPPPPAPRPRDIFIFPPSVSMVACPSPNGGFNVFDAASLGFMGYSYGVPMGALLLSAADSRCGGLVVPPDAAQKVFVEEPVTPVVSTGNLLLAGGIAAALIVLAAVT